MVDMISVCIATYNGEKYIKSQVLSILQQLSYTDEIIISDDHSSDNTIDILNNINDCRIKIFYNNGKPGVNSNFNNALNMAKGNIIFLADQDDVWLKGKVKSCLDALVNADLVIHDAIITDNSLVPQNKTLFSELNIKTGFIPNLIKNRFTGCCMAFHRRILDYVLPIPASQFFYHDNWIGLLCELKGHVKFISFQGILFRRHSNTCSMAASGNCLPFYKKIISRIAISFQIFRQVLK